ncbi:Pro-Pol polyprotein, partial [Dictyocoela muelleri]
HTKITPYNPTSNGISERLNQTIVKLLKIFKHSRINKIIPIIKTNLNNVYNTAIENFPNDIFLNYKNNKSLDLTKIKEIDELKRIKSNNNINLNRKEFRFNVGDKILTKNNIKGKLITKYEGPYTISKIFKNVNIVEVEKPNGRFIMNIKNLKPFYS